METAPWSQFLPLPDIRPLQNSHNPPQAHNLSTSFPMVGKRTLRHWRSKGGGPTRTAGESTLALCVAASSSIHAENRCSWPQLTKSNCPAIPLNLSFCWLHGCHRNLLLPLVPYFHTAYGLGMLRRHQTTLCVCVPECVCVLVCLSVFVCLCVVQTQESN